MSLVTGEINHGHHKSSRWIILEEHQFDNAHSWIDRQHTRQHTVSVQVTLVPSDYAHFRYWFKNPAKTSQVKAVTDAGCELTLIGLDAVYKLGYKRSDLILTQLHMQAINANTIDIVSTIILHISGTVRHGEGQSMTLICYMSTKVRGLYLSE
jgi:hypothetical protein